MLNETLNYFKKHIKDNIVLYAIVSLIFLIGISIGAFTVNELNTQQEKELISYIKGFFRFLGNSGADNFDVFRESIINNTQMMLLIYFLGISVIGAPLILIILLLEGFTLGFTIGLLAKELAGFGILISFFSVLPHAIITVMVLMIASIFAFNFTIGIVQKKVNKIKKYKFTNQLITYSIVQACLACVLLLASIIEAFISPFFMSIILHFMN
ncbi:MAG: stage II sporulation protein M [Alkaliphilus sp.]